MYYIQEADKPKFLFKMFNVVECIEDKMIVPVEEGEEIDSKRANKLIKKIIKILEQTKCRKICISKNLKEQKEFMERIRKENIEIIEGRWLFGILANKALDYITDKRKIKREETNISILVNEIKSDYILEELKQIVRQYKTVNIVTNQISKLKKIEESIFKEEGIIITISNNKKKSLIRSDVILNVDFGSELLNQYNIPENAIIINLKENVQIKKKRFNGISINNYDITYQNNEEFDYDKANLYEQKDIYEASIYQNQPYEYIERKIKRDKVEILYLQGNKNKY